ncbi:MAG: hypothetical protein LBQ49_02180 [Rickettsiales bacterium]|jgi:hypothetical protein|nr:hypothetical protein [Rickettsiales bacterium]
MKKGLVVLALLLSACNSIHMKPRSLDKSETIYAWYGGYHMRHAVKSELDARGYNVVVGKLKNSITDTGDHVVSMADIIDMQGARYVFRVREHNKRFAPLWCMFNGFYFWVFDVSIADQKSGEEILSWSGRGCAYGNLSRLKSIMDELEK